MGKMFVGTLTLRQAKPFKVSFALSGSDIPSVLTGYNFDMTIRTSIGAPDPKFLFISSEAPTSNATVDTVNRIATADVTAAATGALVGDPVEAQYVADARLYHANGDVIDLGSYRINWEPKV